MIRRMTSKSRRKLGKYVVERQIGKGSAANIYLAQQDSLSRKAVVKELLPLHATNDKIITRFQREARLISQLSHDTIIHIYDYWVRNNSYFIAMEYVPGPHLRKILSTVHHLPPHVAAIIIYHICRGLEHAHQNGVIHRDLKPANIMVSNLGQVKILDFGVAHFQTEASLTSLGSVIGTYHYMSPEQALGKKVTPASDVFSLGILFYEMVTGLKPFSSEDQDAVLQEIIHKRPVPVRRINPAVPRVFHHIIKKCLKKNPKRRFQSTLEVRNKLEKYLKHYSLDHNAVLRKYLETLTPVTMPDGSWPPNIWKRTLYRLTHQKVRTYVLCAAILAGVIYAESSWISGGTGLAAQWKTVCETLSSVWQNIWPSTSPRVPAQEMKPVEEQENLLTPGQITADEPGTTGKTDSTASLNQ